MQQDNILDLLVEVFKPFPDEIIPSGRG